MSNRERSVASVLTCKLPSLAAISSPSCPPAIHGSSNFSSMLMRRMASGSAPSAAVSIANGGPEAKIKSIPVLMA